MKLDDSYPIFVHLTSLSNVVSLEIESICGENIPEIEKTEVQFMLKYHWLTERKLE
jgi:hypothetical protein